MGVEGVEAREDLPEVGSLALYWPVLGLAQRDGGKTSRKKHSKNMGIAARRSFGLQVEMFVCVF